MVSGSLGSPKVAQHLSQKSETFFFFLIVGSPVMLKLVNFSGGSLEGLEVVDVEQFLADSFPKCEGSCFCQCGSVTLQLVILVIMSSSSISALT